MKLPADIKYIWNRFAQAGAEVYVVGGAVRDSLMGRVPHDYDLTTAALPNEIVEMFADHTTFRAGAAYGTVGVAMDSGVVEITTFRVDGTYGDSRRPDSVRFTRSLEEDLARRDFTVNAMAYSPERGIVDPFGGRDAIRRRAIETVGDAELRFREDALRILRALRFRGQLGFDLTESVRTAIRRERDRLRALSGERIADEMGKILAIERPSTVFYEMEALGVLAVLFPELVPTVGYDQRSPYHDKTLFDHILCVVDHTPPKLPVRYAALFHDVKKPDTLSIDEDGKGHFFGHDTLGAETAAEILRRYKASKRLVHEVSALIREHMKVHDVMTDRALRRQIRRVGEEYILDLYDLMAADMACTYGARDISFIIERKARIRALMEEGVPKRCDLAVDGNDLIEIGIAPGPLMGKILGEMEARFIDNPEENDKAHWLAYAERRYDELRGDDRRNR